MTCQDNFLGMYNHEINAQEIITNVLVDDIKRVEITLKSYSLETLLQEVEARYKAANPNWARDLLNPTMPPSSADVVRLFAS